MDGKVLLLLVLYCKLLCLHKALISTAVVPALIWDPRNPLFRCGNLEIKVRIGDNLNLVCPNKAFNSGKLDSSLNSDELYENAYLLQPHQEADFKNCNGTDGKLVLSCNSPEKLKSITFAIKETSGAEGVPVFFPGKTYYLIGTADGTSSSLNQKVGGHCTSTNGLIYPLKVKIRVCSDEEITVFKNCSVCDTLTCYAAGCANYTEWSKTTTFLWNGTHCLNKQIRTCIPSVGTCNEELERLVVTSNNCTFFRTTAACESLQTRRYSPSASSQGIATESVTVISEGTITNIRKISTSSRPRSEVQSIHFSLPSRLYASQSSINSLSQTSRSGSHSPLDISLTSGISNSANILPMISKPVSWTPSGCSCPVQNTVGVKQPSSGQQSGDTKTNGSSENAYLIVPSVIGGVVLGIAMCIAAKYVATSRSKKQVSPYNGNQPTVNAEA